MPPPSSRRRIDQPDTHGEVVVVGGGPRAHTPVLLDAGYRDRATTIPWSNNRQLTYSFPPA